MGTLDMEVDRGQGGNPKQQHRHDELLSMPADVPPPAGSIPRQTAEYTSQDARFLLTKQRSFERQYAALYYSRLMALQPVMAQAVAAAWPGTRVAKILNVGEECDVAVVGTLYKDCRLKPSILDEYTKEHTGGAASGGAGSGGAAGAGGLRGALGGATSFCTDDDGLVLEDEGGRMALRSEAAGLVADRVVTGIVLAVRGRAEPGGDFVVSDVLFPGVPPQPERPLAPAGSVSSSSRLVAFVSGLQLASSKADMMQVELLVDFLTGNLGSPQQQALSARIVRLVVAGGSLGQLEVAAGANPYARQGATTSMEPVRDMDMVLTELAAALPVDVMPGRDDPANASLPQQPLHQCLFPGAAPYASFVRATNPHACDLGGVTLLGTSGQPVDDMAAYTRGASRLDLLESCLAWRHLAPTAPDTLTAYPFADTDPFVLEAAPHVLFAGNQPAFESRAVTGPAGQTVRLLCVPSFLASGTLVLLDLDSLEVQQLAFQSIYS